MKLYAYKYINNYFQVSILLKLIGYKLYVFHLNQVGGQVNQSEQFFSLKETSTYCTSTFRVVHEVH